MTTIEHIRRAAQRLRRALNLTPAESLDQAARRLGYESYAHAKKSLGVP